MAAAFNETQERSPLTKLLSCLILVLYIFRVCIDGCIAVFSIVVILFLFFFSSGALAVLFA